MCVMSLSISFSPTSHSYTTASGLNRIPALSSSLPSSMPLPQETLLAFDTTAQKHSEPSMLNWRRLSL